jgi:hypothetical protein
MVNEQNILAKIRAADSNPPAGAYAIEIPSNQYVTGNLMSQSAYTQTKEEDNGNGNTGSHTVGEMSKSANVYLEKIAKFAGFKDWAKRLMKNVREAEPLTQVGMGLGALVGAGKISNMYGTSVKHKTQSEYEERSLKTLQAINRNLNKAVVVKPALD